MIIKVRGFLFFIIFQFFFLLLLVTAFGFESKGEGFRPNKPIWIAGDADFTMPGTGSGCECVKGGSGTPDSPYLIEGLDIDASSADGINVNGVKVHLIIRDVRIHGGTKGGRFGGIILSGVKNARVERTTVTDSAFGILIRGSEGNMLVGNTFKDNGGDGIGLFESSDNVLDGNTVTGNRWGVQLKASGGNIFSGNIISSNKDLGVFLRGRDNVLIGNTIEKNGFNGIVVDSSRNSILSENKISNNAKLGVFIYSSDGIVLVGNNVSGNSGKGVLFEISAGNVLIYNTIMRNREDGVFVERGSSDNRVIFNTIKDNGDGSKHVNLHDGGTDTVKRFNSVSPLSLFSSPSLRTQ